MKFEEVLPAFRAGGKIRRKDWEPHRYICLKDEDSLLIYHILKNDWEVFEEPEPDWEYIIDNKCLCWFWDGDDRNKGIIDYLVAVSSESYELYENTSGCRWSHCCPVRRDEVTFYEDKKDEDS